MATADRTGQEPENTRGSRGTELTTRAAVRIYYAQVETLISEVSFERVSVVEAHQNFDYIVGNLEAHLRAAWHRRIAVVRPDGPAVRQEEETAEAPADTDPPSAVPG